MLSSLVVSAVLTVQAESVSPFEQGWQPGSFGSVAQTEVARGMCQLSVPTPPL